jgi:hypothetical protein
MCTCGCGGNCPNCGCKYNCWGVCSDGDCWASACCDEPPPTCGCCLTWNSSDASCLNDTYYITFPVSNAGYYIVNGEQVNYTQGYIVFQFEDCISCTSDSSVTTDEGIFNFMVWWNQCMIGEVGYNTGDDFTAVCSSLTKTDPGSTFLNVTATYNGGNCCSNINYAKNCYFWPEEVDGTITPWTETNTQTPSGLAFSSYCLPDCDFTYPLYTVGTCMY